ncbi:GNAT family N-acetyltransferase [Mycolicibacterium arseniciresistens]|uniref:GNAT family N-acetyltransferase n=1 Tax=Mycolicibacterium arseniciresistens TaxID=3062257 RepID=A0ABT8UJH3_9MYCO|nr:GNAT family N-acetyltransferase [Mycolicibacterium arseniciresistens]MDO3636985.1 GNAT family N-acetyltransferase [Mycolicibacterium arseniciresistens]
MTDAWQVRSGSADDLESLAPLWIAVHHRHVESMPELAPYVDDDASWSERRGVYAELLAKPDTVLLLASVAGELVGYGLAHVMAVGDTWVADTWRTGGRIGEIESLSVLPAYRGTGLGSQLLEALERRLHEQGVKDIVLGVLSGNTDAIRLYERRGYRPTWLYLSKFEGR